MRELYQAIAAAVADRDRLQQQHAEIVADMVAEREESEREVELQLRAVEEQLETLDDERVRFEHEVKHTHTLTHTYTHVYIYTCIYM